MKVLTALYSLTQAIALTCGVISVSISPIVGKTLAPSGELATLPYGIQFFAVIVCSYIVSMLMKRLGRHLIFMSGAFSLALGGLVGFYSIVEQSFFLNILAHFLFGMSLSAFAYFRFAATDGLTTQQKAKAISLVTLGGIVSSFLGPMVANNSRLLINEQAFAASYLSFTGFALLMISILILISKYKNNIEKKSWTSRNSTVINEALNQTNCSKLKHSGTKSKNQLLELLVAVYASGFGYMLMGLLMMQSSLKLNALGIPFSDIMQVIQWHVMAMFVPSLFMDKVISRLGEGTVIAGGYATMFFSMVIAIYISGYTGVLMALIGIGLGWNMLYVGGSSLVASLSWDAHKMQGINESMVAVLSTIGAFSAGLLFHNIGWQNSNFLAITLLLPGIFLLGTWKFKQHKKISTTT